MFFCSQESHLLLTEPVRQKLRTSVTRVGTLEAEQQRASEEETVRSELSARMMAMGNKGGPSGVLKSTAASELGRSGPLKEGWVRREGMRQNVFARAWCILWSHSHSSGGSSSPHQQDDDEEERAALEPSNEEEEGADAAAAAAAAAAVETAVGESGGGGGGSWLLFYEGPSSSKPTDVYPLIISRNDGDNDAADGHDGGDSSKRKSKGKGKSKANTVVGETKKARSNCKHCLRLDGDSSGGGSGGGGGGGGGSGGSKWKVVFGTDDSAELGEWRTLLEQIIVAT